MIILHTITRGAGGGTMGALQKSISFERNMGHEVWLASGNSLNSDVNHLHIRHLKREIGLLTDIRAFVELWRIVCRLSPDVIHSHESKAGALTRLLSFRFKSPVFVHTVHMATFHSKGNSLNGLIYSVIERILAKKTDYLIFVSPALKKIFDVKKIKSKTGAIIIRSRVDIEKFASRRMLRKEDHRRVTNQLEFPETSKIILSVGLLEPRKRPDFILDELSSMLTRDRNVFLVFLGEGTLRQNLELRASQLNVSSNVRFLGFRNDIEMWVAGADALVLASVFEGFPQIALQSAAAGTPMVATQLEEYSGSTILRVASSEQSFAEEVAKALDSTGYQTLLDLSELDYWRTDAIDAEHKILLDLLFECAKGRK
jgi:glycosyltransferase involved in cell wall biosynthesis